MNVSDIKTIDDLYKFCEERCEKDKNHRCYGCEIFDICSEVEDEEALANILIFNRKEKLKKLLK